MVSRQQQTMEKPKNESIEICDSFLAYKSRNSNADNPLMSLQFNDILKVNDVTEDGMQSSRKIIMERLQIKAAPKSVLQNQASFKMRKQQTSIKS